VKFVYKGRLRTLDDKPLTRMTKRELIDYENYLWKWMDSRDVAVVISAIRKELRWRAEDSQFR
jgi:hypothetical protein